VSCSQEASTTSHRGSSLPDQPGAVSTSPDRLVFQIDRTTIFPGEVFETLDRKVLVISADVPPQDREIDEQHVERKNANAARAVRH
jgi:hypothetical protein